MHRHDPALSNKAGYGGKNERNVKDCFFFSMTCKGLGAAQTKGKINVLQGETYFFRCLKIG